jgi:hypothetical protein
MKVIKHNIIGALLLSATMVFSQSRTQKSSERFNVNSDVIVEINANYSDVTVVHWSKNEVLVETVLSINGVTVEEANKYFDGWNVEALGNKNKVIITSRPDFQFEDFDFDSDFDFNFDFDFEPVIAYGLKFDSVSFPNPPVMPAVAAVHLSKINWDQKAYEKDKEKYLKEFEKQQQEWAEEFEKNFEPQMKAYEKAMEEWEKEFSEKFEPQMKAYEKEMEKWEKDFEKNIEPQLKKHEKMMKEKEKEIAKKVEKMEKEMENKHERSLKMKKTIHIKIPKNARVKVNTHHGSIVLPNGVKRIN